MTVLMLALAVNLEPTRIGLVPLLLSRQKPILQLLAYFVAGTSTTLGFGLLVLFVFHRNPFGTAGGNGATAQIVVGALALTVAVAMAVREFRQRRGRGVQSAQAQPGGVDKFIAAVKKVLAKGRSPWLAALVGMLAGLPSVDYMAVLVVIATAKVPPVEQAAALLAFNLIGSLVVTAPIISYLIAPARTLELVNRLGAWTKSRSRIEYAVVLAFVGCVLLGIGWSRY
jgi:hypothetical protein